MTRSHHISSRLGGEVKALVPVYCHILDELERIHERSIVLRKVCSHLERRIESNVETQLVADGHAHTAAISRIQLAHVHLENTRSIVHRTALQTRERQDGSMARIDIRTELGTHRRLVADHVRICPAETGRTHCLMGVYHDMFFGGFLDAESIMVDYRLAVMVLAVRDYIPHVTALNGIIAILVHEIVSLVDMTLIIDGRRRSLMVHYEPDAL